MCSHYFHDFKSANRTLKGNKTLKNYLISSFTCVMWLAQSLHKTK